MSHLLRHHSSILYSKCWQTPYMKDQIANIWLFGYHPTSFFSLTLYWFFVNSCHEPQSHSSSSPLTSVLHPCNLPSNKEKKSLIGKLYCVTVCTIVCPFVHTSLLANVHCTESWVCFETSGFCYSIYTWFSLRLFLDFMMLPCVLEIMQLLICRTSSFMCSSSS